MTRKRSGIERCLCRRLRAGCLVLALLALAAPGWAADPSEAAAAASSGAADEYGSVSGQTRGTWDDYDAKQAGHPLRITAYALHPAGVLIDWLIFRPAWWVGSHEPFHTLFGRTD